MKKFFTAVPLQARDTDLERFMYAAVGNQALQMDSPTSFPILAAVQGYAQPGEPFQLIAVAEDTSACRRNLAALQEQLDALCARRGLCCPGGVTVLTISTDQRVAEHTRTFLQLLRQTADNDELYCCMTFGTKPLSQAMLLAVQYAYRIRTNASIECIVYGQVDRTGPRSANKGFVYDMTALVQLDEIVHLLARQKTADPEAVLRALLEL